MQIDISKKDLIKVIENYYPDSEEESHPLIRRVYRSNYDRKGHWSGLEELSEKDLLKIYDILS